MNPKVKEYIEAERENLRLKIKYKERIAPSGITMSATASLVKALESLQEAGEIEEIWSWQIVNPWFRKRKCWHYY